MTNMYGGMEQGLKGYCGMLIGRLDRRFFMTGLTGRRGHFQRRLGVCSTSCTGIKVKLKLGASRSNVLLVSLLMTQLDASEFLRKHPWPGRAISDTFDDSNHRQKNLSRRFLNAFRIICGRTGDADELFDDADYEDERHLFDATETDDIQRPFYWSQTLQQNFREELEK